VRVTEFSLRNPLFAGLIATVLALFGVYAFLTLSISIVPNITQPAAIVTTSDPGADPVTIETQVTRLIEDAVASLQNVKSITSTSGQGLSVVTVNFNSNVNTDLMSIDVERAVNSVRGMLPAAATQPAVAKLDTNSALPILKLALYGPQPLDQIEAVAENQVQRALQQVDGVGSVGLSGGPTREIWVQVKFTALQSFGLGLNTVQQALQSNQLAQPAGSLLEAGGTVNVRVNSLAGDPAQLGRIVVAEIPGKRSIDAVGAGVSEIVAMSRRWIGEAIA
jgi:HAE1 family hydrophobic/amphiphilic exporter-1